MIAMSSFTGQVRYQGSDSIATNLPVIRWPDSENRTASDSLNGQSIASSTNCARAVELQGRETSLVQTAVRSSAPSPRQYTFACCALVP